MDSKSGRSLLPDLAGFLIKLNFRRTEGRPDQIGPRGAWLAMGVGQAFVGTDGADDEDVSYSKDVCLLAEERKEANAKYQTCNAHLIRGLDSS